MLNFPSARVIVNQRYPRDTASSWQARQPLYIRSVGRWRCYEKHLGPLFEVLAEAYPVDCPAPRGSAWDKLTGTGWPPPFGYRPAGPAPLSRARDGCHKAQ
jgi:hypothetical protein